MKSDEMTLREIIEEREEKQLAKFATKASESLGREREDIPCTYRTVFQRDRDRILHSKAFRRLMNKTQVFLSPEGDHYTTRLTHSLEVAQIARTISRALLLNEDLTEAIALGHDLGHTPFGHAGERALNAVTTFPFRHNEQSVRVVRVLEREGNGLNLTKEVLDGIENHSLSKNPMTPEGKVVRLSDKIAYLNHDADDAVRAKIIRDIDIPGNISRVLGNTKSERITTLIDSLVTNSSGGNIAFSDEVTEVFYEFRKYMFEVVYTSEVAKSEEDKAIQLVKSLFTYMVRHPNTLPREYSYTNEIEFERAVCDYISGMTDRYANSLYSELFVPKFWQLRLDH